MTSMNRFLMMVMVSVGLSACGGSSPGADAGGGGDDSGGGTMCTGITGAYSATGTTQAGSTCDASLTMLSTSLTVTGDASAYTTVITVGGIAYNCTGIVNGCRWDATCTGMGTDGSMVRGMTTMTFTNTGFSGTLSEDFTGATNCHNQFSITGSRS